MDCTKSLELLSDFHDGALDELVSVSVRVHLAECKPCEGIFQDITSITAAAHILRLEEGISFPDEHLLWQRLGIAKI